MAELTVLAPTGSSPLASIAVTPTNPTITIGTTQQFTATGTYQDGTTQNITSQVLWSASTSAVTITAGGLATGQSAGSATITAAQGSVTGSTTATVPMPVMVSIAVTPSNPAINVGATQQFTATGTYQGGGTQNITSQVVWSASTAAGTITAGGLATGQSTGSATITAAQNG